MNETLTTPLPLLGNGDKPEFANRFVSRNRAFPMLLPRLEDISTRPLSKFELPSWQTEKITIDEEMYGIAVSFFLRAKQAEAKGEITRPIFLFEPNEALSFPNLQFGRWVKQMTGRWNKSIPACNVHLPEESLAQPEFSWSVSAYKGRKSARAFSEETHADY